LGLQELWKDGWIDRQGDSYNTLPPNKTAGLLKKANHIKLLPAI